MANIQNESVSKSNGSLAEHKNRSFSPEDTLENMSVQAGKRVGMIASDVADKTSLYVKNSREYIEENPMKSVAIATAVGLLAGSLLSLTMRRRH